MQATTFTREEVAKHDGRDGRKAYVIVNEHVLDVTAFAGGHPGGEIVLLEHAGGDVTKLFYALHRHEVLEKRLKRLKVGEVRGVSKKDSPQSWRDISRVPYAETDMDTSPYYNESHKRFRQVVRQVLWDEGLVDWHEQAETTGEYPPREIFEKYGRLGLMAMFIGRGPHLKRIPEPNVWSMAGIKPEEIDVFHMSIYTEERSRMLCPGSEDGVASGISIGTGPVVHFGPEWMQGDLVQNVLMGKKVICLAITEPYAGSDVAGILTTARQATVDGEDGFIVRGTKKWITNSTFADYFTTLVKTQSREGKDLGYSMLLVERSDRTVTRPIPTDYAMSAGTGLISFEDAFVPARNLLGKIGQGFQITMHNFNMERWGICAQVLGRTRRVIEECFLWANQREAFGKALIEQPVIRNTLGDMLSEHQAVYALHEKLTHQYNTFSRDDANAKLGGPTALLKFRCTRMANKVSDGAVQIFGGRGVTKTGMGKNITRHQRSFKFASVYGGSEEICVDLGVRLAMKAFPKNAKL